MSEDRTEEIKDARSFEERVFARFDSMNDRFDRLEQLCHRLDGLIALDDAQRQRWEEVMEEVRERRIPVSSIRVSK